jgi:hypothetical protein
MITEDPLTQSVQITHDHGTAGCDTRRARHPPGKAPAGGGHGARAGLREDARGGTGAGLGRRPRHDER